MRISLSKINILISPYKCHIKGILFIKIIVHILFFTIVVKGIIPNHISLQRNFSLLKVKILMQKYFSGENVRKQWLGVKRIFLWFFTILYYIELGLSWLCIATFLFDNYFINFGNISKSNLCVWNHFCLIFDNGCYFLRDLKCLTLRCIFLVAIVVYLVMVTVAHCLEEAARGWLLWIFNLFPRLFKIAYWLFWIRWFVCSRTS